MYERIHLFKDFLKIENKEEKAQYITVLSI